MGLLLLHLVVLFLRFRATGRVRRVRLCWTRISLGAGLFGVGRRRRMRGSSVFTVWRWSRSSSRKIRLWSDHRGRHGRHDQSKRSGECGFCLEPILSDFHVAFGHMDSFRVSRQCSSGSSRAKTMLVFLFLRPKVSTVSCGSLFCFLTLPQKVHVLYPKLLLYATSSIAFFIRCRFDSALVVIWVEGVCVWF